jgi:hypothetical protein
MQQTLAPTEYRFKGWLHCPRLQADEAATSLRKLAAVHGLSSEIPVFSPGVLASKVDMDFTAYSDESIRPFILALEDLCRQRGWRWQRESQSNVRKEL